MYLLIEVLNRLTTLVRNAKEKRTVYCLLEAVLSRSNFTLNMYVRAAGHLFPCRQMSVVVCRVEQPIERWRSKEYKQISEMEVLK